MPYSDHEQYKEYQRAYSKKHREYHRLKMQAYREENPLVGKEVNTPKTREYSFMRDGKMVRVRVVDGVPREI